MQSRRNFIGKVATGLAGAIAGPTCWAQLTAFASASSAPATAARRSCARRSPARTPNSWRLPTSTPSAWKTPRGIAPDAQDVPGLPAPAGR